jgi:heme-degrading monooxygenase HmoA
MFILNVDLSVKPSMTKALESTYKDVFCPAIAKQPGFKETRLLRARSDDANNYRLVIGFENQELQQKWVAAPLHQEVWPKMEAVIAQYSVHNFDSV